MTSKEAKRKRAEKSGWVYKGIHPVINKEWAIRYNPAGTEVFIDDGVRYSPVEVNKITKYGGIDNNIHNVKKIFEGIIL